MTTLKAAAAMLTLALLTPPASALAQCAGCGADFNKGDRDKADKQAHDNADKSYHDNVKDHSGNGMAHDAIDKSDKHNDANDKAFHESDPD